jgi:serine/threonine protein kinase/Flp pilus assembly protein TadD
MSEDQHPPDDPEPTRLDSADLDGGADETTCAGGEQPNDSSLGKRLGDFDLLREIGRGGMGVVYEARQVSLKRRVALKVLPPALGMSGQAKQRFEREAQAAAKLHHTNIVPVYAIGEAEGHHFYAMELIEGQSLEQVLQQLADEGANPLLAETVTKAASALRTQPATTSESELATTSAGDATTSLGDTSAGSRPWFDTVAKLIADVASALDYAHGRGVIHRDIKPANLMLSSEGTLCITDFGLARVLQEPGMTVSGSLLGTPAYMSPEQIAAGRVRLDHRTDVYSLGAVFYELLTLRRAFTGTTHEAIFSAIMGKEPRSPRKCNAKIPQDLETICLKAMEKDPDRRYATAGEMAQDLQRYLHGYLIAARRASLLRRTSKWIRRHPTLSVALIAALVITVTGMVAWRTAGERSAESARRAVSEARLAMLDGDYRRALESAEDALAAAPGLAEARLLRANMLIKLERQEEAAQEAASLLDADPEDWGAHLIMAVLGSSGHDPKIAVADHVDFVNARAPQTADAYYLRSLVQHEPREALALVEQALELDPRHADAYLERIRRKGDLLEFQSALEDCERLALIRPNSAEVLRTKAAVKRWSGDLLGALAEMEQAVEFDPTDPVNFAHRADTYRHLGKHEEALDDLTRAIEIDPERAPLYCGRADLFAAVGRLEEAETDAERALELDPDSLCALGTLLWLYRDMDQPERASEVAVRLLEASEGWSDREARADAHWWVAQHQFSLGNTDEALAEVNRMMELSPDEARGYFVRIAVYRATGREAEAEADCDAIERIVLDAQQSPRARLGGVNLGHRCGRWDSALETLNRLIEEFPRWHWAYYNRVALYVQLGRLEEGLLDADKAIELAPRYATLYNQRGAIYERMHRLSEELADVSKAVELNPYDPGFRWGLATALFHAGRLDEALEECERLVELAPRQPLVLAELGRQLAYSGRCDEAVDALDRARQTEDRSPERSVAAAYVQMVYYACPDAYDSAAVAAFAREAAQESSGDTKFLDTLGAAFYREGRYGEARKTLLRVQEVSGTESSHESFVLSMIAWRLGKPDEARSLYEQAVEWMERHEPANPVLINLRKECVTLLGLPSA